MSLLLTHCSVNDSPDCVFDSWARCKEHLSLQEVHQCYSKLRYGGLSLNQVRDAVGNVCSSGTCSREEFTTLLRELDRRFLLVQDVRWEFNLLAKHYGGYITQQDALFLFRSVHDGYDWESCWKEFISSRKQQLVTRITWDEIELPLCAILSLEDETESKREMEDVARREREQLQREELEKWQIREKRFEGQLRTLEKLKEQTEVEYDVVRQKIAQDAVEEVQRQELLEMQRLEEERLREEGLLSQQELAKEIASGCDQRRLVEEQRRSEQQLKDAERMEEMLLRAVAEAEKMAAQAKSKAEKEAAEKARKEAMVLVRKEKEKKLRHKLDTAIKSRDLSQLEPAIAEVKKEKVPDCTGQLLLAEQLLVQLKAKSNLDNALVARQLEQLEGAMKVVRDGGFQGDLKVEMLQADQLLRKLKRLEEMKAEVVNLNQQKVAEIKSYKKPPLAVHQVMIATFMLLGNSETQTHSWPATQILIGKTGKEALKRRVSICNVTSIPLRVAKRVKQLLEQHDIDSVREASQGCATFYAWAMGMVEERMSRPT